MKIGTCVPTKYYEEIALLGYDYIEVAGTEIYAMTDAEFKTFLNQIEKTKLPIKGYNSYCDETTPIVGDDFSVEKAIAYAQKMAHRGSLMGIKTIGIGSPKARMLPKNYSTKKADAQAVEFLKATSAVAKKYNIMVLFEAVHNHMTDYCNTTDHALKIVTMCQDDNIKLVLDFYHMEVMGEDITKIDYAMDKICHLHVSHLMPDYGRMYITKTDAPWLKSIYATVNSLGYNQSVSIEADSKYFEEFAKEGLEVMKQIMKK